MIDRGAKVYKPLVYEKVSAGMTPAEAAPVPPAGAHGGAQAILSPQPGRRRPLSALSRARHIDGREGVLLANTKVNVEMWLFQPTEGSPEWLPAGYLEALPNAFAGGNR